MRKYEEALKLSGVIAPKLSGNIAYVILMAFDSKNGPHKDYVPFPRDIMPCWGGDMRKYKSTHGDSCTQPDDRRPMDLYQPFPETGSPVAVVLKMKIDKIFFDDILKFTPYGNAFKDVDVKWDKNFVSISSKCGKKFPVDPSAIVSFIFFMSRFRYGSDTAPAGFIDMYKKIKEEVGGEYAMLTSIVTPIGSNYQNTDKMNCLAQDSGYHFASIDLAGFIRGEFNDISGGMYGDGYDYNRKDISLFLSSKGNRPINATEFNQLIEKKYGRDETYNFKLNLVDFAKELKAYVEPFVNPQKEEKVAA